MPPSGSRTLGNRNMDVDRSVIHAPSLDKSMERPQSSHVSPSVGPNQLVALVKPMIAQGLLCAWKLKKEEKYSASFMIEKSIGIRCSYLR